MSKDKLYEEFHKPTTIQLKVINKKNFTYHYIAEFLDKYIKKNYSVLDIGCGAGTISLYLGSKGNKVHGIDISKKAIESCRKSATFLDMNNVTFEVANFPKFNSEQKYDSLVCFEVIEHLTDDKLAFKKMGELLKKDGIAIISTPSRNAPLHRIGYTTGFDKRVGHLRRYTLEELMKVAHAAGFEVIDSKKTEGVLRNYLFLSPIAGKSIRFIRSFLVNIVTCLDELTMRLFGESDLFVVLKKIE